MPFHCSAGLCIAALTSVVALVVVSVGAIVVVVSGLGDPAELAMVSCADATSDPLLGAAIVCSSITCCSPAGDERVNSQRSKEKGGRGGGVGHC